MNRGTTKVERRMSRKVNRLIQLAFRLVGHLAGIQELYSMGALDEKTLRDVVKEAERDVLETGYSL